MHKKCLPYRLLFIRIFKHFEISLDPRERDSLALFSLKLNLLKKEVHGIRDEQQSFCEEHRRYIKGYLHCHDPQPSSTVISTTIFFFLFFGNSPPPFDSIVHLYFCLYDVFCARELIRCMVQRARSNPFLDPSVLTASHMGEVWWIKKCSTCLTNRSPCFLNFKTLPMHYWGSHAKKISITLLPAREIVGFLSTIKILKKTTSVD